MSDLCVLSVPFNSHHIEVEKFYNSSVQLKYFGCEIEFQNENLILTKIPTVSSIHLGGIGTSAVNGGIISFLFDLALGVTAYLVKDNSYTSSVTSRINIHLKKPLFAKSIYVFSKVNQVKRNLIYSEAWVENEVGMVCAKADGIMFTK